MSCRNQDILERTAVHYAQLLRSGILSLDKSLYFNNIDVLYLVLGSFRLRSYAVNEAEACT